MTPIVAKMPMLENGACSLDNERRKYKRRAVFAVCDFPPGCGPNAPKAYLSGNEALCLADIAKSTEHVAAGCPEVEDKGTSFAPESRASVNGLDKSVDVVLEEGEIEIESIEESDFPPGCVPNAPKTDLSGNEAVCLSDIIKSTEHVAGDCPEVEDKGTSFAPESRASVNRLDKSVDVVLEEGEIELMKDGHSFDGLVNFSKSLESTDIPGELLPRSCNSWETLQMNAESITKNLQHGTQVPSKEFIEEKLESPGILNTIQGLEIKDDNQIFVSEEKMFEEGNLPHYAIPSTIVFKERKYPPRRSVSAIRDFPPGCRRIDDDVALVSDMAEVQRGRSMHHRKAQPLKTSDGHCGMSKLQRNFVLSEKLKPEHYRKVEKTMAENYRRHRHLSLVENYRRHRHLSLVAQSRKVDVSLHPSGTSCSDDGGARNKVRETLRLFHALIRKLLHEKEINLKGQKRLVRVDLQALSIFTAKGKYIKSQKPIVGRIPGVEVGDEFQYRVELMLVGLHRPPQAGIDSVKVGERVIATSIVESGGYDNHVDNNDVWIYTGEGGNMTGKDKEPEDQKLERGNLALKNSIDRKNVIRVIRGVKDTNPSTTSGGAPKISTIYTYYGLYTVESYWIEIGKRGKKEFKFELKRVPGQPALTWKEVKKSKNFKIREGRCVADISERKENFPICAVNTIDSEKPPPFTYITRVIYPACCKPSPSQGCDCKNGCLNSNQCSCVVRNGGEIPYNFDGAIVKAKPLVYECGPSCKCPPSCYNRVSQHGIRFELEIFKTQSRGWGVRSLNSIPSGSFICEYTGKLLEDKEAEQRTGNDEYLFDIGRNYNDHSLWEGLRDLIPDAELSSKEVVTDAGFTIDAAQYGNVGRFINHSCSPNLYAQDVLYDHGDTRMPHVMFFAAENIPPLQELTYHYNYAIGQVYDKDGNEKVKRCYCGSSNCTGRMY